MLFDPLSALFVLLITGVGSLIHIYSIGYMEHDARRRRFFGYLNLFVAAMLTLVLASDYLALFLGLGGRRSRVLPADRLLAAQGLRRRRRQEGVRRQPGRRPRHGARHHADVQDVRQHVVRGRRGRDGLGVRQHRDRARPAAAAWRLRQVRAGPAAELAPRRDGGPDARVGADPRGDDGDRRRLPRHPIATSSTPQTDVAQTAVVIVGLVTLLWGAIIGCAKDDIKKGLAGSTMSQIGYMMLAAGIGPAGYAFAIFHLLTHGFFKANLFLGAGLGHARDERRGRHAQVRRAAHASCRSPS